MLHYSRPIYPESFKNFRSAVSEKRRKGGGGPLKPTTQLCAFDITDLYTILPQEESLDILTEFLLQYGYQKVKGVPIDPIRKLARTVITENVFCL